MAASLGTSALRPVAARPTPATPTSSPEPSSRWRLPGASPLPEPHRRKKPSIHHHHLCVVSCLLYLRYLNIVSTSITAVLRLKLFCRRTPKIHTRLVIPSCQAQDKLYFFVEPVVLCSIKADPQYLHYHGTRWLRPPGRTSRSLAAWQHIFCGENHRRGREGS